MVERNVMLVLHDVAPETWKDYQPFVEAVDALGNIPMTLLVVPDFHHRNPIDKYPDFIKLMGDRLAQGDELALHGHFHCDDSPAPTNPRDWFMRRVYTHEGEFYTLDYQQAKERLEKGIALFKRFNWPLHGFVAPAWLMSDGTRQALSETDLRYTSDPQHFYLLPTHQQIQAPGLVWSARSPWRRGLSWIVTEQAAHRHQSAPLIRLGLHPVDMRHDFSRRYWLDLLKRLIADGRTPSNKIDWLNRHYLNERLAA
jgi:predicted deacetylase